MKRVATLAVLIALSPMACANQQQQPPAAEPTPAPAPSAQVAPEPTEPQTPRPPQPPSNTWLARRQVHVSTDQDRGGTRAAAQSIAGVDAIREVVQARGLDPAVASAVIVSVRPRDGEAIDVTILVDLRQAPPQTPRVARELADDLVKRLRQVLQREAQGGMADQLERLKMEQSRAEADLHRSRQELAALKSKVRQATGRTDATAERIRDDLAELEEHRQEIQLELESKSARMNALTENMAKLTENVEQAVQRDAVAAELQKVVEAREGKVKSLGAMVQQGVATQGEYEEAVAEAAEARARLLERRQEAAGRAGQNTLNEWNRELMRLSVDSAELQARLDQLNKRLQAYAQIVDELDQLESLAVAQRDADRAVRETSQHLRELGRQLARIRPTRTIVLAAEDKTGDPPTPAPLPGAGAGDAAEESRE